MSTGRLGEGQQDAGLAVSAPGESGLRYRLPLLAGWLALFALAAWLYLYEPQAYRRLLTLWGMLPFRYPFLDWEGVAAGARCWREGVNVYLADPCDVLGRAHNYSPLWLRAGFLPFGPVWRNIIGLGMAAGFFAAAFLVLRPRSWRETATFAAASGSTMIVFAVERANVDAAVFAVLVATILLSMRPGCGYLAYLGILFVGLLKLYPLVLLATALRERPAACLAIGALSALVVAAFGLAFAGELQAMLRNIPEGGYFSDLFGASNLPRGLATMIAAGRFAIDQGSLRPAAFAYAALRVLAAAACLTAGWAVSRSRRLLAAYDRIGTFDRQLLVFGAALITGCFFAGQSIGYRGVHLLFVVAGLVALRRELPVGAARRRLSALIAGILLLMWDGAIRHVLDHHPREGLRTAYWLAREALWYLVVAVLIGVLGLFLRRAPLLARLGRGG
jgi:hypothetical protein